MRLERLRLTNVRCHRLLEVGVDEGVTILVGANGTGKTTVLEAVALVLRGVSPRTAHTRELISWDTDFLRVEADLTGDRRNDLPTTATVSYADTGERRLTAGGAVLADTGRWEESLPMRAFLPDDVRLVKGSPRRRREYLDTLATGTDRGHARALASFQEALLQRNTLLRRGVVGEEHAPWEALLAREGLKVVLGRARALADIAAPFARAHALLAPEAGAATLSYRTNVADLDTPAFARRLAEQRSADRQRTFTHLGPQRDDMRLLVAGRDLRGFGSQGEQRTALLALLLAERDRVLERGGSPPLLLLDDVMSELDHERRRALMSALCSGGQVVLTTTDLHYFTDEELAHARVVRIGSASPRKGVGEEPVGSEDRGRP